MGFNLHACSVSQAFAEPHGARFAKLLKNRFGNEVPLGDDDVSFCLPGEMAWDWWQALQRYGVEALGVENVPQLCAVDAWQGVYLDVPIAREVLWPDGKRPDKPAAEGRVHVFSSGPPIGFLARVKRWFGIKPPAPQIPDAVRQAMAAMVDAYGARAGERGALQVGNLRALCDELDALLEVVQLPQDVEALTATIESYDNDRPDDDPHIQGLCHAWITARFALENRTPLWLVK